MSTIRFVKMDKIVLNYKKNKLEPPGQFFTGSTIYKKYNLFQIQTTRGLFQQVNTCILSFQRDQ
jgi:hypothetical protein